MLKGSLQSNDQKITGISYIPGSMTEFKAGSEQTVVLHIDQNVAAQTMVNGQIDKDKLTKAFNLKISEKKTVIQDKMKQFFINQNNKSFNL